MDSIKQRDIEIGRVNTRFKRSSRSEFREFEAFVFGNTHSSNINHVQKILIGSVKRLYHGPAVKGFWKQVLLLKPRSCALLRPAPPVPAKL